MCILVHAAPLLLEQVCLLLITPTCYRVSLRSKLGMIIGIGQQTILLHMYQYWISVENKIYQVNTYLLILFNIGPDQLLLLLMKLSKIELEIISLFATQIKMAEICDIFVINCSFVKDSLCDEGRKFDVLKYHVNVIYHQKQIFILIQNIYLVNTVSTRQ